MDAKIILGRILQRLIDEKCSKVGNLKQFDLIQIDSKSVTLLREKGTCTRLLFNNIMLAIKGYQANINYYDLGPSALRKFGITHITSPVFSILHLLPKEAYVIAKN